MNQAFSNDAFTRMHRIGRFVCERWKSRDRFPLMFWLRESLHEESITEERTEKKETK